MIHSLYWFLFYFQFFSETAIPTELRPEARKLLGELDLDLDPTQVKQSIDDEYEFLGLREPKVCVTTSRDPSSRLKQFSKYPLF